MPTRDEALAAILSIALALLVVILAVIAGANAGPQSAVQGTGPDSTCLEWTDSCVVCSRTAQGLACSTPGIACAPGAARCLRR